MRKHGALLFLRPSPLGGEARCARHRTGALRAPSYRRAARATVPARCARLSERRPPPDALRRKAPRSVGRRPPWCRIRRSASVVLPAVRPFQSTQTGSRAFSLGGLLVAASGGRRGGAAAVWPSSQTAAYPATWNRSSLGARRAKVRRCSPRSAAHEARRAGCPSAFFGFSGRCGARKKPAARPRASQRHPPAAPCRGPRCGRAHGRPQPGKSLVARGASPADARRRAPLWGVALACFFGLAPAGGGRPCAVLARAAAQSAAACGGAPLPLPLIRPRRGRVLLVVPWCARAAGRRAKRGARGRAAGGAAGASARRFWAFRPPQLLVVPDRGRACSGVVRVGAWRGGVAAVAACAAKP